jgi:hypothetical protein
MPAIMNDLKLFMVLVGCKPKGRYTEQHDVFFGIDRSLKELIPAINTFWPEAKGKFHIDAWREVTQVNGHAVIIEESATAPENKEHLFFLNLGGYRPGEFEELHYKMLISAENSAKAIARAKQTDFYKEAGFKGAESHVDDKYNLDVDDIYKVSQMLLPLFTEKFHISLVEKSGPEDELHIGYLKLSKLAGTD